MSSVQSNRLLPLLAALMVIFAVFIGMKSCAKTQPKTPTLTTVPVAPLPDADSPADSVRTLTAQVADLKAQSASIERQNKELLDQKSELQSNLKAMLTEEIQKKQALDGVEVNGLSHQIEALKEKIEDVAKIPHNLANPGAVDTSVLNSATTALNEPLQWIEPLGATQASGLNPLTPVSFPSTNGELSKDSGSLLSPGSATLNPNGAFPTTGALNQGPSGSLAASNDGLTHQALVALTKPAYTVPRNATLIGSTAMTALIGKVPFKDTISDPFPFKVIVGEDNLAANGIDIPGVNGMIFSGHTSGDWTLGCVRGNVESVTFVFDDGTIRTITGNGQAGGTGNTSTGSVNNMLGTGSSGTSSSQFQTNAIGWISDRRGIPCVSGVRISNAATYLSGRILARAAESASRAFGQRNVTNQVTPLGGVFSTITGDAAEYAGFNALAGGADEVSQYLKERAAQSFDVVYVDTGVELAVHIDRELPIDYEPTGRKTTYDSVLSQAHAVLD